MKTLLQVQNLTFRYRKQPVISDLAFGIQAGEMLVLMGPNGAGKSTILKLIAGMITAESGQFLWDGARFTPTPESMPDRGIAYVMQGTRVFPTLTVKDNVLVGGLSFKGQEREERFDEALNFFPELRPHLSRPAGSLSGGEQQMCALARALMTRPKLFLLDEPTVGLAPSLVGQVLDRLVEIKTTLGCAILVVEHNLKTLLTIADRGIVLANGEILLEGKGDDLTSNELVQTAFFGKKTSPS